MKYEFFSMLTASYGPLINKKKGFFFIGNSNLNGKYIDVKLNFIYVIYRVYFYEGKT